MVVTHMQKIMATGQSVQKMEWKQKDRQTGNCITSHANMVGKYYKQKYTHVVA